MSDHIPFELQEEIIKICPVKSLLKFRSVSKAWKSLIDSSEFIAAHSLRHAQPQRLLLRYNNPVTKDKNYICFIDDNTFPPLNFAPALPLSIKRLFKSSLVGSSQGLLCFFGYHVSLLRKEYTAVIWNPSIRKSIDIVVPNIQPCGFVLGFGVCPVNFDPKIVKITQFDKAWPWKVEVYTLSSRKWRILSTDLSKKLITVTWSQVVVDNFIYWSAFNHISGYYDQIIAFHLTNEIFILIELPVSVAFKNDILLISNPRDSLGVGSFRKNAGKQVCEVWEMNHDVEISFTKLFTIKAPHSLMSPLGFRKSGELIMHRTRFYKDINEQAGIVVYDPELERVNDLWFYGIECLFFVDSYMETLLLHDQ